MAIHVLVMGTGPGLRQDGKTSGNKYRRVTMTFAPRRIAAVALESRREVLPPVLKDVVPPPKPPVPPPETVHVIVREIPAPLPVKEETPPPGPAAIPAKIAGIAPPAVEPVSPLRQEASGLLPVREARPLYKKNPPPAYPAPARRRGLQGTVRLEVLVDRTGRVEDVRLAGSSGQQILDRAALQAVRNWLFEPGMQGNEPMAMWVMVPVRFQLR